MNTLYLTSSEQALYDNLSVDVKDGWEVETEELTYDDTYEQQIIRLSLVRLHDPSLIALRDKAAQTHSLEEVAALMRNVDLKMVEEDDLAELCFAIGPSALSQLISLLLAQAQTDKDIEGVTALSVIRHAVLRSLQRVS